jgi:hypothetical protein
MFAFLRSNLYPTSIAQQPELKSCIDTLRFLLVSNSAKIRENTKHRKSPLSDIQLDDAAANVSIAALSEILLKELRFCHRTISFVTSVTMKFHDAAFDNTDMYIGDRGVEDLESQSQSQESQSQSQPVDDNEETFTPEQSYSSRLLVSSTSIRSRFIELCGSLEIRASDLDECSASTDSSMFAAIHATLSSGGGGGGDSSVPISTHFERLCDISRAVWQMMNVLAFSDLYRYHYEYQKNPVAKVDLNPADSVFATRCL